MLMFTVITPTSNRLAFLKENVQSIQQQVLGDESVDQVILASGEAGGETGAWLTGAEAPANVTFVDGGPELLRPGLARNRAIEQATGDWILILDDDDVMLQRTVHYFAEAIRQNPDRRWFISDFVRVDSELRYVPGQDVYGYQFGSDEEMLKAIFSANTFAQGNVCFERKLFDEVGGYDEDRRTAEDLELYTRFVLAGAVPKALPIISHLHRVHTQNTSKDIDAGHHYRDLGEIYAKLEQPLKARGIHLDLPSA